jgi:hypothetical protein
LLAERDALLAQREAAHAATTRPGATPNRALSVREEEEIGDDLPAPLVLKAMFPKIG